MLSVLGVKFYNLFGFINVYAVDDGGAIGIKLNSILKMVAYIGGGVIALFLIIALVKDGIAFASGKGDASIVKILGKIIFLLVIIGMIFAVSNWDTLRGNLESGANEIVSTIGEGIDDLGGGSSGN